MTGVALIGTGMVAATYVAAIRDLPGVTITGLLAHRPGSAERFAQAQGLTVQTYPDVAAIAADPAVDFAIVLTPPNARQDIVGTLAAAGKPILMEKPVERTLAGATALVETCERAGVPLGIVLQHRARPSAQALARRVGGFGPLRMAEINVPWWRPQSYYDQPGRGSYARDGGGVMINQAIHTLDLALQFTGPVREVVAMTATTGLHRMESEDFVTAGLTLASGAVASFFATTAAPPGRGEEILLHYDSVSAHLQGALLTLRHHDGRDEVIGAATTTGAGADPMAFTPDWHRAVIADFAAALAEDRPPMIPGRSALPVHALIEAIETAGRTGRRTDVRTTP